MNTIKKQSIEGYASYSGDGSFTLTITNHLYALAEVKEAVENGELSFTYGDTILFDDGGHEIATIEWESEEIATDLIKFDDDDEEP